MSGRMDLSQALGVLHELRGDAVVMPTMSTVAPWARLEPHPLDFVYLPSSMGQVTALALGLALARPERRVVALSGDGSLLMNLGSLVSIATAGASNLVIIVVDNGVYQVTGGQPTPAGPHVDLAAVARGCGVSSVHTFETVDAWRAGAPAVLGGEGPTVVVWKIEPDPDAPGAQSPGPARERVTAFRRALLAGESDPRSPA